MPGIQLLSVVVHFEQISPGAAALVGLVPDAIHRINCTKCSQNDLYDTIQHGDLNLTSYSFADFQVFVFPLADFQLSESILEDALVF